MLLCFIRVLCSPPDADQVHTGQCADDRNDRYPLQEERMEVHAEDDAEAYDAQLE